MSLRERITERVGTLLEENLGYSVVDSEELNSLQETALDYADLRVEAEDLAWRSLEYYGGKPQELRNQRRKHLAQRSRVAWMQDPLAGTEAEHYANFTFSKGVSLPLAADKDVQKAIERGWKDPGNMQALTSLDALRAISNELRCGANVFPVAFPGNGRVKVSFLNADHVTDVVTSPDDRLLPLYYVTRTAKEPEWDMKNDTWDVKTGEAKVTYWPHWNNADEAIRYAEETPGAKKPPVPPKDKLGPGYVYHMRMNRLLEAQFGVPLGSRTLRFWAALNRLMEARVSMAQAASSIIAKRVVKGGPTDVLKAAQNVLAQTGEIGASQTARQAYTGMKPGTRPGSTAIENESSNLQAVSLNSGAAQAQTDIQQVRAQAVAPSALGQHYYGDQSTTTLASGSTLELPALMAVNAYSEIFEQLLRWFTDMLIQEAVRNGDLGGNVRDEEDTGPSLRELRLCEADDMETAEARTGKDLSYSFSMPFPGRRDAAAVTTQFTEVMTQLAPIGENEVLLEAMLNFLFTNAFEFENASELATRVTKRQQQLIKQQQEQQMLAAQQQAVDAQGALNQAQDNTTSAGDNGTSSANGYGAKLRGTTGTDANSQPVYESLSDIADPELQALLGEIEMAVGQSLGGSVKAAAALNGSHA